jgi:hypothetical protein
MNPMIYISQYSKAPINQMALAEMFLKPKDVTSSSRQAKRKSGCPRFDRRRHFS